MPKVVPDSSEKLLLEIRGADQSSNSCIIFSEIPTDCF